MIRLLFLAFWLLLPLSGHADVFGAPPAGDKSFAMLTALFGDALTGSGTMGPMFKVFNEAMLSIGGIILGYTLVAGIMQTAHDGEMLGKRYSSLWVPIRTVVAVAAIIPVGGTGYSFVQKIAIQTVSYGISLGDNIYAAGVKGLEKSGSLVTLPPSKSSTEVAKGLLRAASCAQAINIEKALAGSGDRVQPNIQQNGSSISVIYGGPGGNSGLSSNICGGVVLDSAADANSAISSDGGGLTAGFRFGHYLVTDTSSAQNNIAQAKAKALNDMVQEIQPVAYALMSGQQQVLPGLIATETSRYDAAVRAAIASAVSSLGSQASSGFANNAIQDGWVSAGAWYHRMAMLNDKVATAASSSPRVIQPNMDDLGIDDMQIKQRYARVDSYLSQPEPESGSQAQYSSESQFKDDPLNWLFNEVGLWILKNLTTIGNGSLAGPGTINPLIQMKNVGDYVMSAGELLVADYIGLKVGVGALKGESNSAWGMLAGAVTGGATSAAAGAASSAADAIMPFVVMAFIALFFYGIMLSTYLPLLPFIIWMGAVIGWLVTVVECVISAPLWAVLHLNPEGEGIGQRTENGYIFFMAALLRPSLLVLSFMAASAIMLIVGALVNDLFMTTVAGIQANSTTGLGSIIGFLIAYAGICSMVIHKSMDLIHIIPDRLLQWIGNATAPGAHDATQHAEKIVAAGHSSTKGAASSGAQSAQSAAAKRREAEAEKAAKAATGSGANSKVNETDHFF